MIELTAFRDAVLGDARTAAAQLMAAAGEEADGWVHAARADAEEVRTRARQRGQAAARHQLQRRVAAGRQQAREQVLRARRDVVEALRSRALARVDEQRGSADYGQLRDRLEEIARQQLGAAAAIVEDPDSGGIVARSDGRQVDYRLPVLVDRVVAELGAELEELWR